MPLELAFIASTTVDAAFVPTNAWVLKMSQKYQDPERIQKVISVYAAAVVKEKQN